MADAWYLKFSHDSPQSVTIPEFPSSNFYSDWVIQFRIKLDNSVNSFNAITILDHEGQPRQSLALRGSGDIIVRSQASNRILSSNVLDIYSFNTYRLESVSGVVSLYLNGSSVAAGSFTANIIFDRVWNRIKNNDTNGYSFEYIYVSQYGETRNYNASLSNGTGLTLTDELGNGSTNGTLVNFPTDNSQWVLYDDGTGGGEVTPQLLALINASQSTQAQSLSLEQAQALVTTQAQQSTTATLLSLVQSLALESISSQQVSTTSLLSLAQTLLIDTINATQITQAETLTLSQRGSQALDLILASQTTNAELLSLAQSLIIESIQAQQITNAETLTLEQAIGQSLSLASAQQVTQASLLSVEQQSKLALIVAQQVSQSQLIDIDSAQAISMVFAEQITTAETLDLTQQNVLIDGQVITLISATQNTTTSTLLISKIALADLINAEQITTTTALSIAENSKLVTIDAEQVTLATLLNLSQTADGTSLKGLTLTDITSVYSLNEINKTTYTLKEL